LVNRGCLTSIGYQGHIKVGFGLMIDWDE